MKKEKINLSIIIPVHSVKDPKFDELLNSALLSIDSNEIIPEKVMIVRCACADVTDHLDSMKYPELSYDLEILENPTGKSFQNQINFAATQIQTKYFSFLEFDDEYSKTWFKNVQIYTEAYPEIGMFLPIITDITDDNQFAGFMNEAAWAFNFSDEMGYLDHEVLLEYPNINPDGMVINTKLFNTIGGYKPSIKLTFNYEFLLRYTKDGEKIMVIPKIGYKHRNMRPGSLFWEYKNSEDLTIRLEPEEASFWMDLAKKEFYHSEDRGVTYTKEL